MNILKNAGDAEIIGVWPSENPETDPQTILEKAGRTCYQSEKHPIDSESADKFVRMVCKRKHYSVIEHGWLTLGFPKIALDGRSWHEYLWPITKFMFITQDNRGVMISANLETWRKIVAAGKLPPSKQEIIRKFTPAVYGYQEQTVVGKDWEEFVCNRIYADEIRTIEEKLNHIAVTVKFSNTSRGTCYIDDTKVLTDEGWMLFTDLLGHERVLTKDDEGNLLYEPIEEIIIEDWDGEMREFKNTELDLIVTPNHNMWVFDFNKRSPKTRTWKFIKAKDMTNGKYNFDRTGKWEGNNIKEIKMDALYGKEKKKVGVTLDAKKLMKLLGIWVTDGSISFPSPAGGGRRLALHQTKKEVRSIIEELLNDLGLHYATHKNDYRIACVPLWYFIFKNFMRHGTMRKSLNLKIPQWLLNLSPELLKEFLEGVFLGDGYRDKNRNFVYSSSLSFCEDLVEIALKLGHGASIREYRPAGTIRYFNDQYHSVCQASYVVNVLKEPTLHLEKRMNPKNSLNKPIYYRGKVCCVKLAQHHRLYVMRNGKPIWSGNSHELVRHRIPVYSQESTRYVDESDFNVVIPPHKDETVIDISFPGINGHLTVHDWLAMNEQAYRELRKSGWKAEDARQVLPIAIKAEIVCSCNLLEWRYIFEKRCAKAAHWEIRAVMLKLLHKFQARWPELFNDFVFAEHDGRAWAELF